MIKQEKQGESIIAVMGNDIGYIKKDVGEIKDSLKSLDAKYPSREEIKNLEERVDKMEIKGDFWRWFSPTLGGVLGSIVTFLVISYLQQK